MSWVVRCSKTGMCDWVESSGLHLCSCGGKHKAYEAGAPPKERGATSVIPDTLRSHFDWSVCRQIESRSQRNRIYADKGMNLNSIAEDNRNYGDGCWGRSRAVSYSGQRSHKSTAERGGVRTKTGQRVI